MNSFCSYFNMCETYLVRCYKATKNLILNFSAYPKSSSCTANVFVPM